MYPTDQRTSIYLVLVRLSRRNFLLNLYISYDVHYRNLLDCSSDTIIRYEEKIPTSIGIFSYR